MSKNEYPDEEKVTVFLTCNLAASSHTSSLFGQFSQPCFMSFRAATILPACSSKRAAAIHPGSCFGFDLMRESNNNLARLIPPISASDLMMTLSSDVRYPFGSTDVAGASHTSRHLQILRLGTDKYCQTNGRT